MRYALPFVVLIFFTAYASASAPEVYFIQPKDGSELSSPVEIKMGVRGMSVEKAGVLKEGTGHHHLIVNKGSIEKGKVVPADKQHIHYGGGQTEASLELEPGEYTLTLQFADGLHKSYGEPMSSSINITVK